MRGNHPLQARAHAPFSRHGCPRPSASSHSSTNARTHRGQDGREVDAGPGQNTAQGLGVQLPSVVDLHAGVGRARHGTDPCGAATRSGGRLERPGPRLSNQTVSWHGSTAAGRAGSHARNTHDRTRRQTGGWSSEDFPAMPMWACHVGMWHPAPCMADSGPVIRSAGPPRGRPIALSNWREDGRIGLMSRQEARSCGLGLIEASIRTLDQSLEACLRVAGNAEGMRRPCHRPLCRRPSIRRIGIWGAPPGPESAVSPVPAV